VVINDALSLLMSYNVAFALQASIARGLAYAPYCDLLWMETSTPSLEEAKEFADAIHAKFPGKLLAYNCSPSFNWKRHLNDAQIANYQKVRTSLSAP
jgi:isocitrate lyase